eukprot:jgi/Psemu1/283706/fgenesh1_pg.32_\
MIAVPFAHTGERHKDCGAPHMEERCGRPLGLLELPPEDRVRYQRFLETKAETKVETETEIDSEIETEAKTTTETPLFLAADAYKGLLLVSSAGTVVPLLESVDDKPLFFANALARARDGTIYLSDSSSRFRRNQVLLETLESRPSGRIVSWHPDTETSRVVADHLAFPNGLVLRESDNDHDRALLVSLTTRHQIVRIDLNPNLDPDSVEGTPRPATATAIPEVFASLPGFPDNLHVAYSDEWKRSVLWVGSSTKSSAVVRFLNVHPRIRQLLAVLPPDLLMRSFKKVGLLLALDLDTGSVLRAYQDPTGTTPYIAGIQFDEDYAYLGSWKNRFLARIPRDKLFAVTPAS